MYPVFLKTAHVPNAYIYHKDLEAEDDQGVVEQKRPGMCCDFANEKMKKKMEKKYA